MFNIARYTSMQDVMASRVMKKNMLRIIK